MVIRITTTKMEKSVPFAICQHFLKITPKTIQNLLHYLANNQTNKHRKNISSLAGVLLLLLCIITQHNISIYYRTQRGI